MTTPSIQLLTWLTKAEVSPSVCTPLSPSLCTPHQILYSAALSVTLSVHINLAHDHVDIIANNYSLQVYCLDGDGAAIMHLGVWATVGQSGATNLKHIVFNNGVHESVGAQPTAAIDTTRFSFTGIAQSVGYKTVCVYS